MCLPDGVVELPEPIVWKWLLSLYDMALLLSSNLYMLGKCDEPNCERCSLPNATDRPFLFVIDDSIFDAIKSC